MKILIVSDTHGRHSNLDKVLEHEKDIDMLLHLGDVENGEDYIETITKCPVYMIAGNNDFFSYLPMEREIRIGKYKVFMTHGHGYYVSMDTKSLRRAATARGVDIVMFGHTHRPYMDVEGSLKVINPGSLSYPRQEGRRGTYIIMEIDRNGEANFELRYV